MLDVILGAAIAAVAVVIVERLRRHFRDPFTGGILIANLQLFQDKDTLLPFLGTRKSGKIEAVDLSLFTLTAKDASGDAITLAKTVLAADMAVPGSSVVIPKGTTVPSLPAPNAIETITYSVTNFQDGDGNALPVADLAVDYVAEPIVPDDPFESGGLSPVQL